MSPGDPLRVVCPHGERCAGCPLLSLDYPEQLAWKRDKLASSLAPYRSLAALSPGETRAGEPVVGYRTRAKWMLGPAAPCGGPPPLGLYTKSGDHEVLDIPGCRVVAPVIGAVGEALRALVRAPPAVLGFLRSPADGGALEAVDLREVRAEGEAARALVTLVVSSARSPSLEALGQAARALAALEPRVAGVAVSRRRSFAPQVLGPETEWVWGERELWDRVGASSVLATFGSFVQAHRGQSSRLHEALAAELAAAGKRPARVLDLYGGSGAIALSLAALGARVDLVESFGPAAAAGRGASEQGLSVRALTGDAAEVARELSAAGERYDLVVVNPPRRGLSASVREALAGLEPPRVAYVSCDPRTLARDLDHLGRLGYATLSVDPYDMIPLTAEVESLALLGPGPLPPARVLLDAGSAVFVEKGAHEPTTPQGEHRVSLLDRVRLVPGLELAVPVHRLDVGTSGVCLFARTASEVHPWALALGAPGAVKTYLAGVKGVASSRGVVKRPLKEGGKMIAASTRYRRLAVASGHSLLAARPEQGRTHQIRRHLAGIGHAVLGDERYGDPATARHFAERYALDRTFLHCLSIELDHPASGERVRVMTELPPDLGSIPGFAEAARNAERDFANQNK